MDGLLARSVSLHSVICDPSKKVIDHFLGSQTSFLKKRCNLQFLQQMNNRRDNRSSRSSLLDGFDGLEEGGIRASSSYSRDINEHDNDKAIETLQDRVVFLKRLTGDIHEEVESHNRFLDRVGNGMDGSRGMMLGTMDRFKKVFEKKSTRKTCSLVGYFTVAFIVIYYLISFGGCINVFALDIWKSGWTYVLCPLLNNNVCDPLM
ncbi:Bet1-like SNARE 1-2 [Senna tora]|uniref:Bet1-like SNARE 1-2 n=1 Tax=Senna tora TaxID=362788 RepID=A0A834X4D9_9FABA|nr:Bet1-like SNARE 1-2 [Senna tora]